MLKTNNLSKAGDSIDIDSIPPALSIQNIDQKHD